MTALDVELESDDPVRAPVDARPSQQKRQSPRHPSRLALICLAVVLSFGAYARVVDLGKEDLWFDEVLQAMTARSIVRGDGPRLPSGEFYTRGLDVTRLVAISQQRIADPEAAARAPAAVFGIACLLVFAAMAWRMSGPWSAVWSTMILGVFPVVLQESRNSRFYTLQLLYGLVALYAGWRAVQPNATEDPDAPDPDIRAELTRRWGWVALTVIAFLAAGQIQYTTASVAAGWGLAVAVFAAVDLRRWKRDAFRRSVPVQLTCLGLVAMVLLVVAQPAFVRRLIGTALNVPLWAQGDYSPRAYYWALSEAFPLLVSLLPVVYLVAARRNLPLSLYLFTWFAVPFFLHSFVFRFQADRYIILALPGLVLAAGIAAADGCGALYRAMIDLARRHDVRLSARALGLASGAIVGITALAAIATNPSFIRARKLMRHEQGLRVGTNWTRALAVLRSSPELDSLPWGTQDLLPAKWYWNRIDFATSNGLLEQKDRDWDPKSKSRRSLKVYPQGTPDFYLGVPVYSTAEAIRDRFGVGHDVIIAIDSTHENGEAERLMQEIRRPGSKVQELCASRCGTLHLFRWTLPEKVGGGE